LPSWSQQLLRPILSGRTKSRRHHVQVGLSQRGDQAVERRETARSAVPAAHRQTVRQHPVSSCRFQVAEGSPSRSKAGCAPPERGEPLHLRHKGSRSDWCPRSTCCVRRPQKQPLIRQEIVSRLPDPLGKVAAGRFSHSGRGRHAVRRARRCRSPLAAAGCSALSVAATGSAKDRGGERVDALRITLPLPRPGSPFPAYAACASLV
jgi:hypothetical protein